jgi:CIC family chloride channel protein
MAAAGSGLGVAFSAPLGGAMFTLEEVTKELKGRLVLATLLCTLIGCVVSMNILGPLPDYLVNIKNFELVDAKTLIAYSLFGMFVGVMGDLYNKTVLFFVEIQEKIPALKPEIWAFIVGLVVAVLLWYAPNWAAGGDNLGQQMLNNHYPIYIVLLIGLVRWFFAPLCYSTGVPGGLFSPLLLMGGILGHVFCWTASLFGIELNPLAFCAVGMAAFFCLYDPGAAYGNSADSGDDRMLGSDSSDDRRNHLLLYNRKGAGSPEHLHVAAASYSGSQKARFSRGECL